MNYYEVYDRLSGDLLARGTARECYKQIGRQDEDSFRCLVRVANRGRGPYLVVTKPGGATDYPVLGKTDPVNQMSDAECREMELDNDREKKLWYEQ